MTEMTELNERQKRLLKAIVEKYVDSGVPVGSEIVEKEFGLGVSPATIRNEMVKLTSSGYLRQPHTSAGRIPTSLGIKLYINELMEEKKIPVKDEVAIKERLWDDRYNFDRLIRQAVSALAEQTRTLSLATTSEGDLYSAGAANILDMPEFYDIDLTKTILSMLDRFEVWDSLLSQAVGEDPLHVLFGEELKETYLEPCGFVFIRYDAGRRHSGTIGVVGPYRLNYPMVIPTVRYFGDLISEVARSW